MTKIKEPKTKKEFEDYYRLRWDILRAPYKQPKGSEKDDLEDKAIHLIALDNKKIIGVGRGHFNNNEEAQVRYMAIDNKYQGKGIGGMILDELEKRLKEKGARYVVLNARETALNFYKKHGYEVMGEAPTLYGKIKHSKMRKDLR